MIKTLIVSSLLFSGGAIAVDPCITPSPTVTVSPTPSPTVSPTPTPSPSPTVSPVIGRPSKENTGPVAGTVFKKVIGSFDAVSNTTYQNLDLTGKIVVKAGVKNVTIKNCKIHGSNYGIQTSGTSGGAANVKILNNEIYDISSAGIYGGNFTAQYNEIYQIGGDGFKPQDNSVLEYNYVHRLGWQTAADAASCGATGSCPHADGIQVREDENIIVRKNFFFMPQEGNILENGQVYKEPTGYSTRSNRTIFTQVAGNKNITIEGNWLWAANDFNVQSHDSASPSTIVYKNNIFYSNMLKPSGKFLYGQNGLTWTNNKNQFGKVVTGSDR